MARYITKNGTNACANRMEKQMHIVKDMKMQCMLLNTSTLQPMLRREKR